ncbi:hypothetical protein SAV31267_081510 [Streptomyces avermitilis]|uniref:XdhC- CoxI domain-containing protein n=1 Tax=Streptomyces avermitilis TaxID=33903 RepID=A0A4D4N402_STRAX|nr:hypothetical protein SAVMC3_18390 [Streptomyces avermitilis]GDY78666.1 hypothetical protein SAV31267_081510 [Streptomyces avermitilis]
MLDIAEELNRWVGEGRGFAVATVVAVGGSAPRPPGAALAVDSDGTVIGSVSGGCVEAAVYDSCVQALQDGTTVLERFGYSDDDAFAVGLTCGGVIEVLVTPVGVDAPGRTVFAAALSAAARGRPRRSSACPGGPPNCSAGPCWSTRTDRTKEVSTGIPGWTGRRWPRPARCWTRAAPARSRSRRAERAARAD